MFISLECMYLFLFILKQLYHINCSYTNIFFFFSFCYKKSLVNKRKSNCHTTHSLVFQPALMKQTTGSDSSKYLCWMSKQNSFQKWGNWSHFLSPATECWFVSTLSTLYQTRHTYTNFPHIFPTQVYIELSSF